MLALASGTLLVCVVPRAGTQEPHRPSARADSLLTGAVARDRARLAELVGARPDTTRGAADSSKLHVSTHLPALRFIGNSDVAYSQNDGALWAGRGPNLAVSGGVTARYRHGELQFEAAILPTIAHSGNRPFQVMPGVDPRRSALASPWYTDGHSADLPLRFGTDPITSVSPGETWVRVTTRNVTAGAGWMSRWWGPGIRNAILLSGNAAPIPQVHVGTARPVSTRIGDFSALLLAGTLTESIYFDLDPENDYRSLSGLRIDYRPAALPTLSLGLSRLVMRPGGPWTIGSIHEVLTRWDNPPAGRTRHIDQLLALDARWIFPASGFEVYGELAVMDPPRSLYALAVNGHHSQGYTLGTQWLAPTVRPADRIRLHAELTYLEQSIVLPSEHPPTFYTGRATSHGFTQRGQVIGAAIGPGASSQWFAADYVAPAWTAGLFAGRTRWDNDAMYQQPAPNFKKHDVTIYSGARGSYRHRLGDASAELTIGRRMNYLFQSAAGQAGGYRGVDLQNITLGLAVTPRQPIASLLRSDRATTRTMPAAESRATPP